MLQALQELRGATKRKAIPLSSLTRVASYNDPQWMSYFHDLATYSFEHHIFGSYRPPMVYRKGWEWVQTVWGLDRLGMITDQHRAIGVGAGRECVIFWLGDRIKQVVATDLYGNAEWTTVGGQEADAGVLENPQAYCPRPIRTEVIEFKTMDGTDLSAYPEGTFDVAWSLSSIEHFGGHSRSALAVREMARVVRRGGVVVIATELLLLDDQADHPEFFTRQTIQEHVVLATDQLELIEPIDWSLPPVEYLIDAVAVPHGVDRTRRHVVLNDGYYQWTSWLAFFRKR